MMIRKHLTLALLITVMLGLNPVNVLADDDAGRESPFDVGVGARALGMGGGFVSLADDATAVYYNPAGLARLQSQEITFMYMSLFEGTDHNFGSYVYPSNRFGGFGISFSRIGTGDIPAFSDFMEIGTIDYSISQLSASYGLGLTDRIASGVTFSLVNQSLGSMSDYGLGVDFGLLVDVTNHISAGVVMRNALAPELTLDSTGESLPTGVTAGLALKEMSISEQLRLTASVDLNKTEDRSVKINTGAELLFDRAYALRAGYDQDNFAFGAGFIRGRLHLDYAYKLVDYIDDSHRFSVSYLIGPSVSERSVQSEQNQRQHNTKLLAKEREKQFEFYRKKGDEAYDQFELDSALAYYHRALAFDEGNEEIAEAVLTIEKAQAAVLDKATGLVAQKQKRELLAETYLDEAQKSFDQGRLLLATRLVDLSLTHGPGDDRAHQLQTEIDKTISDAILELSGRAQQAEKNGQYLQAFQAYSAVLQLDPTNTDIAQAIKRATDKLDLAQRLNLGIALFLRGEYILSRGQFSSILGIDSSQPIAREYIRRIDDALAEPPTLDQIEKDTEVWPVYLEGLRLMRENEYQKAIDAWLLVLQSYPNNSNTLENIRQAQLRLDSAE